MWHQIDLSKHAPRSARVRLGGFVILPRMLDKGRATIAGKPGDYKYNCPLDQRFVNFVGIDAEALKRQLEEGKGDAEILEWIRSTATHARQEWEIEAWSRYQEQRVPTDIETREFFHQLHSQGASNRIDVGTWFDLLDVDDYVSFGGKA